MGLELAATPLFGFGHFCAGMLWEGGGGDLHHGAKCHADEDAAGEDEGDPAAEGFEVVVVLLGEGGEDAHLGEGGLLGLAGVNDHTEALVSYKHTLIKTGNFCQNSRSMKLSGLMARTAE